MKNKIFEAQMGIGTIEYGASKGPSEGSEPFSQLSPVINECIKVIGSFESVSVSFVVFVDSLHSRYVQ